MVAGSCTGAICGGIQSEKFGRRKSLLFDCFIYFVGTILSTVAPNFNILLVARVILGHSVASAMTTTPVYTRLVYFWLSFMFAIYAVGFLKRIDNKLLFYFTKYLAKQVNQM